MAATRDQLDAAVALLAIVKRIPYKIPDDLPQVALIEPDREVRRNLGDDHGERHLLGGDDVVEQPRHPRREDDLRCLSRVAAIELHHFLQ